MNQATILEPGRNCYKLGKAQQVSVLVDARAYFSALYKACQRARQTIYIFGWDIDSQVELVPKAEQESAPRKFRDFLEYITDQNPDLQVYILCWDFSLFFSMERDRFPRYQFQWKTKKNIQFRLDGRQPFRASHHQKCVIIDDQLLFLGGIDICRRRFDDREHKLNQPLRTDPEGKGYGPFHDLQVSLQGELAKIMGEEFRQQWERVSGDLPLAPVASIIGSSLLGEGQALDWGFKSELQAPQAVGAIARTRAAYKRQEQIFEVEQLYIDMFAAAERYIYVESQYLTADNIIEALVSKLKQPNNQVEVVLVLSTTWSGIFEQGVLGTLENQMRDRLLQADHQGKLRIVVPVVRDRGREAFVKIHSKACIIDDCYLRIGSANLNNRSMRMDTEYDLVFDARLSEHSLEQKSALADYIASLLADLLGEHTGMTRAECQKQLQAFNGSLIKVIDEQKIGQARRLEPVKKFISSWAENLIPVEEIVDPKGTQEAQEQAPKIKLVGGQGQRRRLEQGRVAKTSKTKIFTDNLKFWSPLIAFTSVLILLATLWRFTELGHYIKVDVIVGYMRWLGQSPWAFFLVMLAFMLSTLLVVPLNILIIACALAFRMPLSFLYIIAGAMGSAYLTYYIGRWLGAHKLQQYLPPKLRSLHEQMVNQGLWTVMFMRLFPVAPFTVVNLICGAFEVRLGAYLAGTFLGLLPGVVFFTLIGKQARSWWQNPEPQQFALLAGYFILFCAITWLLKKLLQRTNSGRFTPT